jgi:hypothetical protein
MIRTFSTNINIHLPGDKTSRSYDHDNIHGVWFWTGTHMLKKMLGMSPSWHVIIYDSPNITISIDIFVFIDLNICNFL